MQHQSTNTACLPTTHPLQGFKHRRFPLAAQLKATSLNRCGCARAQNTWAGSGRDSGSDRGEWGRVALASLPSNPDLPWQQAYSERSRFRLTVLP